MEADPGLALNRVVARLAVDASALLHRAFRASGLQARELAARLGVTEGRVSQVLHGDGNIRVTTLGRYLRAMGFVGQVTAESLDGTEIVAPRTRRPAPAVAGH